MIDVIREAISESINVKNEILQNQAILDCINSISGKITQVIKDGGKVLVCGNGGSAGDAQHIAGEFINRFYFDRPAMGCIALTTDTSVITAIANDSDYSEIFLKQVIGNGRKGDIFWGISTSGNSENIVKAMKYCREIGLTTFGLTGANNCEMDDYGDYIIKVPSIVTPRIQEAQMLIAHIICQNVERGVYGDRE